ncbi:MAG: hypothetical protein LBC19_06560 [Tannerella sp.]|nr:hypothetical protein [Tannerella sp.]
MEDKKRQKITLQKVISENHNDCFLKIDSNEMIHYFARIANFVSKAQQQKIKIKSSTVALASVH